MIALAQRLSEARVDIDAATVGAIDAGLLRSVRSVLPGRSAHSARAHR